MTEIAPTLKQGSEVPSVSGKAICFNERTLIHDFWEDYYEIIERGALDGIDLSDIPLTYNHDAQLANCLAHTKQGTLTLDLRDDGLYFDGQLTTNRGADVYAGIKLGEISKCSFAFLPEVEEWNESTKTRTIKRFKGIYDVSIVDYPAYDGTNVSARSKNSIDNFSAKRRAKEIELLRLLTYC